MLTIQIKENVSASFIRKPSKKTLVMVKKLAEAAEKKFNSQPEKIKIPKLEPDKWYKVKLVKSKCYIGHNSTKVSFKSQRIEGVKINSKEEIYVPTDSCREQGPYLERDEFEVKGWKLNEFLKHKVIQGLRDRMVTKKK